MKINEKELIQMLSEAGDFDLKISKETDNIIVNNIYDSGAMQYTWKERVFSAMILRPVLALFILGILTFSIIKIKNMPNTAVDPQELYNRIISQIQQINMEKDLEKAIDIYSEDFFQQNNKDELKKNIAALFRDYAVIKYEPTKEKIIVDRGNAMIENKIKYYAKALNKNVQSLLYQGKERIYLKRFRDKWKIVAWVYEGK